MTKNQQEEKKQTNEPAHLDDPFKDAIQFDKKVIKQRAIKTAFAAGGTLAVAIPVTVAIYYAVTPFNLMPPDVVGAIGFVVGNRFEYGLERWFEERSRSGRSSERPRVTVQ